MVEDAPAAGGTYVLLFYLPRAMEIEAGRLGRVTLPAGWLAYVGSAHGPGGLRARLARHFRREKRIHWHIDALTTRVSPVAWHATTGDERLECTWAQTLAAQPDARIPAPGFGSSDCRAGCPAHLIAFPKRPDLEPIYRT
ncbi:MAG: GIY-YIG nuclease family protein [Chloroflexi bacterium]|nr:GIY-YIG nuclease family protein [Chloroflexota bacterium]